MKSDVVLIKKGQNSIDLILNEVEKVAKYTSLDGKKAMHLRLLAEELNNMLPELSKWYEGKFYIEANENEYILHANFNSFDMNLSQFASVCLLSQPNSSFRYALQSKTASTEAMATSAMLASGSFVVIS